MHYYRILGGIIILFAIKQRSTIRLFDSFFFISFIRSFDAFLCTSFFTDTFDLLNDWFECVCHCAGPVMCNESDRKAKAKAVAPVFAQLPHSLNIARQNKVIYCQSLRICNLLNMISPMACDSHCQSLHSIDDGFHFCFSNCLFSLDSIMRHIDWFECFVSRSFVPLKKAISSEILMNIEQWDERLNDMDAISEHNGISFNGNNDCTSQRLWIFCVIKLGKQHRKPSLKGIYVVWAE